MGADNAVNVTMGETPIERAIRLSIQWRRYLGALFTPLPFVGTALPKGRLGIEKASMVNFSVKKRFDINEFLAQKAPSRRPNGQSRKPFGESPRSEGASDRDQLNVDENSSSKNPEMLTP